MNRSDALIFLSLSALALGQLSCGSGGNNSSGIFEVNASQGAVDTTMPIEVRGGLIVYFEDESFGGTMGVAGDLNGDTDTLDSVAVVVNVPSNLVTPLGVAARAAHIAGSEIYLEVVEADDDFDWNGDGVKDDTVLVHWSATTAGVPNGIGLCNAADVCYVDDLDPLIVAPAKAAISHFGRVYYSSGISDGALAALASGATSLNMLETTAPLTPVVVTHTATGQRRPRVVASDPDGLLVLAFDETVEPGMVSLNSPDADDLDTAILALLDGSDPNRGIKSTELAMPLRASVVGGAAYSPVRARRNDLNDDWLVGFMVSEADQNATNFNDRDAAEFNGTGWEPTQCMATPDTDATDSVLHFLHFEAWFADSVLFPPRNTGLVGRVVASDQPDRVVVVEDYVGTISDEASAECNLNVDASPADMTDSIVRWANAPMVTATNILPPGAEAELHALEIGLAGASEGLSSLAGNFVIVVDEAMDEDDFDLDTVMDKDLIAWLDPASTTLTTWTFNHSMGDTIGASWMNDTPESSRLGFAFQESAVNMSLNAACQSLTLADADTTDELPAFARFANLTSLIFPGVGVAMAPSNPGLVIEPTTVFFRASEAGQGVDLNGDGDMTDFILVRNSLFNCQPFVMGTVTNPANGDNVVMTDGFTGAAFIGSETDAGIDFNDNGNIGEDVLMFFLIP